MLIKKFSLFLHLFMRKCVLLLSSMMTQWRITFSYLLILTFNSNELTMIERFYLSSLGLNTEILLNKKDTSVLYIFILIHSGILGIKIHQNIWLMLSIELGHHCQSSSELRPNRNGWKDRHVIFAQNFEWERLLESSLWYQLININNQPAKRIWIYWKN